MTKSKILAPILVCMLLAGVSGPLASAQTSVNLRSVGEIFVDAQGRASGQNVAATVLEARGALQAFTSLALGAEIFSDVSISGWTQVQKIQGVGSSAIALRGSNAVVTLHDNARSEFRIQATSAADVTYKLAAGARAEAAGEGVLDVRSGSGAYLGSLVLLSADGAAGAGSTMEARAACVCEVRAHLESGSQIVFRAKPVYVESEAQAKALVELLASGKLAAEVVTEFSGGANVQSNVDHFASVWTDTSIETENAVHTRVASSGSAGAVVAFDLAHETLAVESGNEVAVYVDGKLAAEVRSAAEVAAAAEAGTAAYFATKAEGRTQVVASTPSFNAQAQHSLTVLAKANAQANARVEAQARAEWQASFAAKAEGRFSLHSGGKVTGSFSSAVVANARAEMSAYVNLATKTEVFAKAKVEGDAWARASAQGSSEVRFEGQKSSLTLRDDAYASLALEAKAAASATFDLGAGVHAYAESNTVVRLESSAKGYAGTMVVAKADGSVAAASKLTVEGSGRVKAQLEAGARVIVQGSAQARAHASAHVVASAVAEGKVGAHVVAGVQGSAVATTTTHFYSNVDARVHAAARGEYEISYRAQASAAATFVFDAQSSAALAAKSAADIQVYVNGRAAARAESAQAAIEAQGRASYHVETTAQSQVRVIVNTGVSAGASADVKIVSRLNVDAKANAKADAFGSFKLYHDGSAVGSYVSLKTDVRAGVVADFALAASGEVFAEVKAGASAFVSAGAEGAAVLHLENNEAAITVTDTTTANLKVVAKADTQAEFRMAGDVRVQARGEAVVDLDVRGQAATMILTSVDGRAAAGSSFEFRADGTIVAHLKAGAQVIFRTHVGIETELSVQQRAMLNAAIASGKVGGQVFVQTQASLSAAAKAAAQASAQANAQASASAQAAAEARAALVAAAAAEGSVTTSITASYYNDVQLVTAATKSRVDVTVSSTVSAGKTIVISLDGATISGIAQGNAQITLDGEVAVQASSYADILNPSDDGGAAEYFVLVGEAGAQVLVSIPHFSTRVVSLRAVEPEGPPVFLYATLLLAALVVGETVWILRRRNSI
ncbi:MAG TPA: polymer-forming cytoskeletal protein [Candidatus Thermoplasmatota archaeon]|nr:polymer-forming cytoskeletal protein [Candidatus Thermoplasmatota archaeon]